MNQIEQILANSLYDVSQFNTAQIAALNEMLTLGISGEQCSIIANPDVNELSYSIIADYLSKGNTITSKEYTDYLIRDNSRINEVICQVYLGKLHELTNDQIDIYAQAKIPNIKIARILIEKCKDKVNDADLNTLINGTLSKTEYGKIAIQDFLNDKLSIEKLLLIINLTEFTPNDYNLVINIDIELIKLYKNDLSKLNKLFILCKDKDIDIYFAPENECLDYLIKQKIIFDNVTCLRDFLDIRNISDIIINRPGSLIGISTFLSVNKKITTSIIEAMKYNSDDIYAYEYFKNHQKYKDNDITYYNADIFTLPYDQLVEVFKLKCTSLEKYNSIKAKAESFGTNNFKLLNLLEMYTKISKKESKYLIKHLENVSDYLIEEVQVMKKNNCTDEEIHYYIENYLDEKYEYTPSRYYKDIKEYKTLKNISIINALKVNTIITNEFNEDIYTKSLRLIGVGATEEELQFYLDNHEYIKINEFNDTIQMELFRVYKEYNDMSLIGRGYSYVNYSIEDTQIFIKNYEYAKSIFKDKHKCISCFMHFIKEPIINSHLVKYIDNFNDDIMYKILKYKETLKDSMSFIEFCLQMSEITTDYYKLKNMYESADKDDVNEFNQLDEKITTDIVIKFCKDAGVDQNIIKEILPVSSEEFIEETVVESFNNSKNFKAIQYDENNTFIDIVGNKDLLGTHVIKFSKNDEEYEYIFEIAHEGDNLQYSVKINTKADVIDAINKSIALIENIEEYKEYVSELQSMIDTF